MTNPTRMHTNLFICILGKKHQLNVDNIMSILTTLSTGQRRWLDLCCGQAWHFSMIKDGIDNGLDDRIEPT